MRSTRLTFFGPAGLPQHRSDAAIAIAARLESERRDVCGQRGFVVGGLGDLALCGTMLTENPGCPALGHFQFIDDMIHEARRRAGLRSFPWRPLLKSACQGKVGNGAPEPSILRFQLLQALHLVTLQATVFGTPLAVCNLCYAYRPNRFRIDFPCKFSILNRRSFMTISSTFSLFAAISMSF